MYAHDHKYESVFHVVDLCIFTFLLAHCRALNKSQRVVIVSSLVRIFTTDEFYASTEDTLAHQGNLLLPDEDNRFIANFVFITNHYRCTMKNLSNNDAFMSTIEFGHKIHVRQIEIIFAILKGITKYCKHPI